MPDFAYDEMKKLFPGASDDEVMQKIASIDQPQPQTIEGPDTLITANAPNPYKDMAIQNVKDKYGLDDKYSPESRQKLLDEVKQSASGPNWSAGLASLGAGIAGQNADAAGEAVIKRQGEERANKINTFDTGRSLALKSRDDALNQEKMRREGLLDSDESKMAQDLAISMGMDPVQARSSLTATKFKEFSPIMEKKYQIAQSAINKKDDIASREKIARILADSKSGSSENNLENFKQKEEIKEDTKVRTENRKERKQLDKDLSTWDSLDKQIDEAITNAKNYNSGWGPGTGILGKIKSGMGSFAPEAQQLDTSLQKLGLDQMVKQFSGMSKAIDTPAERAQFEKTVPSMGMDNALLMKELMNRKNAAVSAKQRILDARNKYDKYGRFTDDSDPAPQIQTNDQTIEKPSWAK